MSRPKNVRPKVGFDASVLKGRYQGSKTVLARLATAMALAAPDMDIQLYSSSSLELRDAPENLKHVKTTPALRLLELAWRLPSASIRNDLQAMIYQYIMAPWEKRGVVVIHDILPITHPHLFSLFFRLRSAILFSISIISARLIVSVSEYTSGEIAARFPSAASRVVTVPNGPSFSAPVYFSRSLDDDKEPFEFRDLVYILCVGRIEKRKNIDLLISAFKAASLPAVSLVIVGALEGEPVDGLEGSGVVHLTGVSDEMLISLYRSASLFVYPSEAEGFGLPLLDSVLFGVPTLASGLTAMPEVGGALAEYFDPTQPDAATQLAARITAHFGGHRVRAPSLAARVDHAARYSWERSGRILIDRLRVQDADARQFRSIDKAEPSVCE